MDREQGIGGRGGEEGGYIERRQVDPVKKNCGKNG